MDCYVRGNEQLAQTLKGSGIPKGAFCWHGDRRPAMDFHADLQIAKQTETEIGYLFKAAGFEVLEWCNNDYRYDLRIQHPSGTKVTVEIKEDFTCARTGNVGLEFWCRGKPSGIDRTEADVYLYKVHQPDGIVAYYAIDVEALRQMIEDGAYHRVVTGGDPQSGSQSYLFRLDVIKEHAKRIFLINSQ